MRSLFTRRSLLAIGAGVVLVLAVAPISALADGGATPVITTIPSPGGPLGTVLSDKASLTGLYSPATGDTVDFSLYSDSMCSDLVDNLGTSSLSGPTMVGAVSTWAATSPSPGYAPSAVQQYYWGVTFTSVNDLNNATTTVCGEPVTISAGPELTTTNSGFQMAVGTPVHDSATITGLSENQLSNATVTFEIASSCLPSVTPLSSIPITPTTMESPVTMGNATWSISANSGSYQLTDPGEYHWYVVFNSNTTPNVRLSECDETFFMQTSPVLRTYPSPATGGAIGQTTLTDTATISGLYEPLSTDAVTFGLYSDASCTTLVGSLGTFPILGPYDSPVSGPGTYRVFSSGYKPTTAGTYWFGVVFDQSGDNQTGDDFVNPKTSVCGEPVTITAPLGDVLAAQSSQGSGAVLGASTPNTGADLSLPGLLALLSVVCGVALLTRGLRLRRRPGS